MANNILITPASASIQFSGSGASTIELTVDQSGSLNFVGLSGSLFSIVDSLSGSLFAVSDDSGMPSLEVRTEDIIIAGEFGLNTLYVSQSVVGIRTDSPRSMFDVSGSAIFGVSASDSHTFTGSVNISGNTNIGGTLDVIGIVSMSDDLVVLGTITAQEFHTEFVSSSIIFDSGSTKFGDTLDDTHQRTGSMSISGTFAINGDPIDFTGAADNDLLYRSGGSWINTGGLTWDGSELNLIENNLAIRLTSTSVAQDSPIYFQNSADDNESWKIGRGSAGTFDITHDADQPFSAGDWVPLSIDTTTITFESPNRDNQLTIDDGLVQIFSSSIHGSSGSDNHQFTGSVDISGSFDAQHSSIHGSQSTDTHLFTGSVDINGSVSGTFSGSYVGDGSGLTGMAGLGSNWTASDDGITRTGQVEVSGTFITSGSSIFGYNTSTLHQFTGSLEVSGTTRLTGSTSIYITGSDSFNVFGDSGSLFNVIDVYSGSLFSISGVDGIPIFEVFSDDTIVAGEFGLNTLFITASKFGILTDNPRTDFHVSGSTEFGGIVSDTHNFTGSVNISGSLVVNDQTAALWTGSTGTISRTGDVEITGSLDVTSLAQFANVSMSGDLNVGGTVTAQEFHTEFVSSSIIYDSGSTKFGDTLDDTHQRTGSLFITGSTLSIDDTDITFYADNGTTVVATFARDTNYNFSFANGQVSFVDSTNLFTANNITATGILRSDVILPEASDGIDIGGDANDGIARGARFYLGGNASAIATLTVGDPSTDQAGILTLQNQSNTFTGQLNITRLNTLFSGYPRTTAGILASRPIEIRGYAYDASNHNIDYKLEVTPDAADTTGATSAFTIYHELDTGGYATGLIVGFGSIDTVFYNDSGVGLQMQLERDTGLTQIFSSSIHGSSGFDTHQFTGSVDISGSFDAQQSSIHGSSGSDTHLFTGSVDITGSLTASAFDINALKNIYYIDDLQAFKDTATSVILPVSASGGFTDSGIIRLKTDAIYNVIDNIDLTETSGNLSGSGYILELSSFSILRSDAGNTISSLNLISSSIDPVFRVYDYQDFILTPTSSELHNIILNLENISVATNGLLFSYLDTGSMGMVGTPTASFNLFLNTFGISSDIESDNWFSASNDNVGINLNIVNSEFVAGFAYAPATFDMSSSFTAESVIQVNISDSNVTDIDFKFPDNFERSHLGIEIERSFLNIQSPSYDMFDLAGTLVGTFDESPFIIDSRININSTAAGSSLSQQKSEFIVSQYDDNIFQFSGSVAISSSLDIYDTRIDRQFNSDIDIGVEAVASVPTASYNGAFFDYTAISASNGRAGTIMAIWVTSSVEFTDTSTPSIGDTSNLTFEVIIVGSDARLDASASSDNWSVKTMIRMI